MNAVSLRFFSRLIFLLLVFLTLTAMSGGFLVRAQSDRVIVNRPADPLDRNATRPDRSEYEKRVAGTGTPSEVEAELRNGKEAFEAKPPRYDDAEVSYLDAAKLNPNEARAYMGLGTVYAAKNRADDAIKAFQKAKEVKPKLAAAYFNLGLIYSALGKKDKAMEEYRGLQTLDKTLAQRLKEVLEK